jgi:rare lipoprotein A
VVALLALAAGCASTPRSTGGSSSPHYKVGKSYQVNGRWYHPEEDPDYTKVGVASWYGSQFHGRMTANGEIFDMNLLSAAHTTLPLPSMVEVTNLENGRSLVVRVNDRGPFARDRIIDMSREAARQLGFEREGTAKVRVRYAGLAPLTAKAPRTTGEAERVARAAPVRETPVREADARIEPAAPQADEISTLLTSMESAPALTQGAEDVAVAQAEGAEIPAADLSTADPDDSVLVHQGVSAEAPPEAIYLIRVAALSKLDQIDALRAQLGDVGVLRLSRVETEGGTVFYRVNLGPFASIETAAEKLAVVRGAGYADASLVTLTP